MNSGEARTSIFIKAMQNDRKNYKYEIVRYKLKTYVDQSM